MTQTDPKPNPMRSPRLALECEPDLLGWLRFKVRQARDLDYLQDASDVKGFKESCREALTSDDIKAEECAAWWILHAYLAGRYKLVHGGNDLSPTQQAQERYAEGLL